jgi:uncharacterized protein (TIGR03067 family)
MIAVGTNMSRCLPLLVVAIAVLPAVSAPRLKDVIRPEPMLGRWAAVGVYGDGKDIWEGNQTLGYEFTADGRWQIWREGKPFEPEGRFTVDRTTEPPTLWLRAHHRKADDRGNPAVYKIEGDFLIVAWGRLGTDRAGWFDRKNASVTWIKFARVKPK